MGGRGATLRTQASGLLRIGNDEIDLSGSVLRYGRDDARVSGAVRTAVEAFEDRRRNAKIEYGVPIDANGNPVEQERRGGKGAVRVSVNAYNAADTYTHIHPRGAGILGGTFSEDDLWNFATFNAQTTRAAAKEGTYSISKTSAFNKNAFEEYIDRLYANSTRRYRDAHDSVQSRYDRGEISYSEAIKESTKAFNKNLVDLHNELLAGQKQYGYTYTLERRKR